MAEEVKTFTSVFYETSTKDAAKRLHNLRQEDRYREVKAYISKVGKNNYRVLRKIEISH